jgi:hypothetical protein
MRGAARNLLLEIETALSRMQSSCCRREPADIAIWVNAPEDVVISALTVLAYTKEVKYATPEGWTNA